MPNRSQGLPDSLVGLLSAADARHGFPPGTMASVMQQEVGGQLEKFLSNPAAYHFAANAQGQRIAPHSGRPSSAFGPFGILDSTAQDPGWGVQPLTDKSSLDEQIRFASDYLAARVKQAGDFTKGLAGYGEGDAYAQAVVSRIPGFPEPQASQATQMAQVNPVAVEPPSPEVPQLAANSSLDAHTAIPPEWDRFRGWVPRSDPPAREQRNRGPQGDAWARAARTPDFSQPLGMARALMADSGARVNEWEAMRGWL